MVLSLQIAEIGAFPFTDLAFRYEEEAVFKLREATVKVHLWIPTAPLFPALVDDVRQMVSSHVKNIELTEKRKYKEYIAGEIEKQERAREQQYQEYIKTMEVREAEAWRKHQEEKDIEERRRQEYEIRHRHQFEQQKALMEQRLSQAKKHNRTLAAMQEKTQLEQNRILQKMMQWKQEYEVRVERERQEQMKISAERDQQIQELILQLANRPPQVIEEGEFCLLC
jgi:hypothetical protein